MQDVQTTCVNEAYEYGTDKVSVVLFDAAIQVHSRSVESRIGATTKVEGLFSQSTTTGVGNGIFGMDVRSAFDLMRAPSLDLSGPTQFLFDAVEGSVKFGDFDIDSEHWVDVETEPSVSSGPSGPRERYNLWIVPGTRMGDILFDTGDPYILLPKDAVDDYFSNIPLALHTKGPKGYYYLDCEAPANQLPDLNIDLANSGSAVQSDKVFPVQGSALIGRETSFKQPGRNWCFSLLQYQSGQYPALG